MSLRTLDSGTHSFDGWLLTPEGAAIHAAEQTAVVADVHLGYEWARGAAGDCVVAHSLDETLERLSRLLERARVSRLIVAGDLIESSRPCRQTEDDVRRLREWLAARGSDLLVLEGNHDEPRERSSGFTARSAARLPQTCTVAGWMVGHGHRLLCASRTISGHHHPVLRYEGAAAPCFMVGPDRIVLPAFSSNAAGCDVVSAAVPKAWRNPPLRVIASTGCELLDFGLVSDLRRRFHRR
jgi:putative SbcD/Mre11-related phosphoesterase